MVSVLNIWLLLAVVVVAKAGTLAVVAVVLAGIAHLWLEKRLVVAHQQNRL
jgi:hypothetical protein